MNRADRRRAAHPHNRTCEELFSIALVRYADRHKVIAAALAGDAAAAAKLSVIWSWIARYQRERDRDCVVCGELLRSIPRAIIVVLPLANDTAIAGGLCPQCSAQSDEVLLENSLIVLVETYGLRTLDAVHFVPDGGRA